MSSQTNNKLHLLRQILQAVHTTDYNYKYTTAFLCLESRQLTRKELKTQQLNNYAWRMIMQKKCVWT